MAHNTIDGNPTKKFFIEMITRDISIEDAIIDLLDNSIDGANNINPNDYSDILFAELIYDDTLRLLDEKKEIYTVIANIDGQINTFFR